MLDPISHVAFSYSEASRFGHGSRAERLRYALSTIGISVMAGSVSTAGSCAVLFMALIIFFSRFAALFCSLMLLALLYANAFLAPLLLLFGPTAGPARTARGLRGSAALLRWPRWLTVAVRGQERGGIKAADGAAEAAIELERAGTNVHGFASSPSADTQPDGFLSLSLESPPAGAARVVHARPAGGHIDMEQ